MTNYNIGGFVIIMEGNPLDDEDIYFPLIIGGGDEFTIIEQITHNLNKLFPERKFTWSVTTPTTIDKAKKSIQNQIKFEIMNRC